jgi:hypothetical protein
MRSLEKVLNWGMALTLRWVRVMDTIGFEEIGVVVVGRSGCCSVCRRVYVYVHSVNVETEIRSCYCYGHDVVVSKYWR